MGAAFGDWDDVVDFLSGDIASCLEAAFADRMLGEIQRADSFPSPPVNFVRVRIAAVLVILAVRLRSVGIAVPAVGQVWAAGKGAGFLRLMGHKGHLLRVGTARKGLKAKKGCPYPYSFICF